MISASHDGSIKLWDLDTQQEMYTFTGHRDPVFAVAIAPDGKRAISACADKTIKIWNLETQQEVYTFTGHSDSVYAAAIAPDGKRVISASWDKTLKLWKLETGEVIDTFSSDVSMSCCAVAPDGVTIVAGESSGRLHFLHLKGVMDNL